MGIFTDDGFEPDPVLTRIADLERALAQAKNDRETVITLNLIMHERLDARREEIVEFIQENANLVKPKHIFEFNDDLWIRWEAVLACLNAFYKTRLKR
jgi:hypothetical protein